MVIYCVIEMVFSSITLKLFRKSIQFFKFSVQSSTYAVLCRIFSHFIESNTYSQCGSWSYSVRVHNCRFTNFFQFSYLDTHDIWMQESFTYLCDAYVFRSVSFSSSWVVCLYTKVIMNIASSSQDYIKSAWRVSLICTDTWYRAESSAWNVSIIIIRRNCI